MSHSPDLRICLSITVLSLAVLGVALVMEYVFGIAPCVLCTYQRVPFVLTAGFGLFGTTMLRHPVRRRRVVMIVAAILAVGAAIAFYHAGVEHGWWTGTRGCTGEDLSHPMNLSDVTTALSTKPVARCDDVPWTLFGFSLSEWNFAASSAFALICLGLVSERRLWREHRFSPRG